MNTAIGPTNLALLNRWQRDFPLTPRPFAAIGNSLGQSEQEVLSRLADLIAGGLVTRIGAIVRPNTVGASTLAAVAAPRDRVESVARRINAEPSVNHNYEREHRLNLWFVVTAPDRATVQATLNRLSRDTGLEVVDLPLERAYHIDLGFDLSGVGPSKRGTSEKPRPTMPPQPDADDCRLLTAIEGGLPLLTRPYVEIASRLGWSDAQVTTRLARLAEIGVISRFGVIVRHRKLGYRSNAMAVWDVPDADVDRVADEFAAQDFVTLCYRRPRRQPHWPYNLFCMIHGRDRPVVLKQIAGMNALAGTSEVPQTVLFSTRCFKQRGARYAGASREAAA